MGHLFDDRAVCTADTLFVDGGGRTELQFGDDDATGAEALHASLHGTLLAESDFVTVFPGARPGNAPRRARGVDINTGREGADGDVALQLELGPNDCAARPTSSDRR